MKKNNRSGTMEIFTSTILSEKNEENLMTDYAESFPRKDFRTKAQC